MADIQHDGDKILHQDSVEEVVSSELEDISTHAAIDDLEAPSVGYVQAEATATNDAVNAILSVLRDAKLIPAS